MAIKISGLEFKKFYADDQFWPVGAWHDGEILVDGVDDVDLTSVSDDSTIVADAVIYLSEDYSKPISFATHFRKWQKKQSIRFLLVQVDAKKYDEVVKAIHSAGGKIR